MLRKLIIVAALVFVPIAFYVASQYGDLETLTFEQAIAASETVTESDRSKNVIVVTTITSVSGQNVIGEDRKGRQFKVDYTGSEPDEPFTAGLVVRFVGHVHGAEAPYFHALQVYGQ